jgi:hypothetical protein
MHFNLGSRSRTRNPGGSNVNTIGWHYKLYSENYQPAVDRINFPHRRGIAMPLLLHLGKYQLLIPALTSQPIDILEKFNELHSASVEAAITPPLPPLGASEVEVPKN